MSVTNITTTVDATNWPSIQKVAAQTPTAGTPGSATDENLLVIGTFTVPNNAASIFIFTKCLLALNGAGNRLSVSGSGKLNLVDSVARISGNGATRVNNYFTELTRSKIIGDGSQSGTKFIYTLAGANIQDAEFVNIHVHELSGTPTTWKASYSGCTLNILNWSNGDMSLTDITLGSTPSGFIAWLGSGSAANRFRFRDCTMAFTTVSLAVQSGVVLDRKCFRYWSISEQLLSGASPVQDAVIIYRSDQTTAGVQAEISRYTSDSNGRISGGKHYQMVQYIIDAGTSRATGISEPSSVRDYTIATVANFREIRSYGHDPLGNIAFDLTAKAGDSATGSYVNLYLITDDYLAGISYTAAGALAATHSASTLTMTGALTLVQLYASRKAYWRLTDSVLFGSTSGDIWDLGALNISSTFVLAPDAKLKEIKTSGSITLTSPTVLRYSGTGSATITDTPENAVFDGLASVIVAGTTPVVTTVKNSAQGLLITAPGSYDVSAWTFSGNTADVTVADGTGAVTIVTGGATLTVNQGTGNTVTIDNLIDTTFTVSPAGGTFALIDATKFKVNGLLGVYTSHAAGQSANPGLGGGADIGKYYAVDADSNGVREEHGYWDGAAWQIWALGNLRQHAVLSSSLGGAGAAASFVVRLPPGSQWRWLYDALNYTPQLGAVTAGGNVVTSLVLNSSFTGISGAVYTDVLTNYLPLAALLPADSAGVMTGLVPALPAGDIERAIVFVEYMRLTLDSAEGALVTGDPLLLEIVERRVIIYDDTFRVKPLPSYPSGTKCPFGAWVQLINYTIPFAPVDANGNFVSYGETPYTIVNAATVVGRVSVAIEDKDEIKNHVTAMSAAFS
jgi:hypothetical protein